MKACFFPFFFPKSESREGGEGEGKEESESESEGRVKERDYVGSGTSSQKKKS